MLYTAEIDRLETKDWAVVKIHVKDTYYYVPTYMLPRKFGKGDQITALMLDGKIVDIRQ